MTATATAEETESGKNQIQYDSKRHRLKDDEDVSKEDVDDEEIAKKPKLGEDECSLEEAWKASFPRYASPYRYNRNEPSIKNIIESWQSCDDIQSDSDSSSSSDDSMYEVATKEIPEALNFYIPCSVCQGNSEKCVHYQYNKRWECYNLIHCIICHTRGLHWSSECPGFEEYRKAKLASHQAH